MKTWKSLLLSLCVAFGLFVFVGTANFAFNAVATDQTTYISVKGATFWNTTATGSEDYYYVFVEFTDTCNGAITPDPNTLKDNLTINGKTMAEINAYSSGAIVIKGWNSGTGETKLWLQVSAKLSNDYGFKNDGTDIIAIKQGLVVRNGYVVREDYKARLADNKFYRIGEETVVTGFAFYDTTLTGSNDYFYIFVAFDKQPKGLDPTDPHTMQDDFLINGVSMRELNALKPNAVTITSWEQGSNKEKLMLTVLTNIGSDYGLKMDGADVVTVKKGAVVRNGNYVSADYSAMLFGSTFYTYYPQTNTEIAFNSATLYKNVQTGWDWLYLIFDRAVTDTVARTELTANMLKDIKINGQTIGEYNATATSKINAVWGETQGNIAKLRMMIPSTLSIERLQVANGFTTVNGKTLNEQIDLYLYTSNGMNKFIAYAEPNGMTTEVSSMSVYPNQDQTNDWLFINFTEDIVTKSSREFTKYVYDYVKINDKTVGQILALDADAISVEFPTGTNCKQLLLRIRRDSHYGISSVGTYIIEILNGFTGFNGASTKTDAKNLFYNKNGICHVLPFVKPNGQTVEFGYMSMYLNQDNESTHFLYMNFNGEITNATSRGVYTEYFYDYIIVNGKTLGEILELTPGLVTVEYPTKTQLLLRIVTEKLNEDEVIKLDGTDVFTVKKGFTGLNGVSTDKDYSYIYYNKNGMNKFMPYAEPTGSTVKVTSVEIYPQNPATWDSVYIIFDDVIGETYGSTETQYIYDYIKINGRTLGEIKAINNGMSVLWKPGSDKKLLVYLKSGVETGLKLDDTDRIEVLEGFMGQNGAVLDQKYDKVYYNATMVDTDSVAGQYEITESVDNGQVVNLKVRFLLAKQDDGALVDLSQITFNGVTVSNIDGATVIWKTTDGKTLLDITLPKSVIANQNTLVFLSGLYIWDDIVIGKNIELKYDQKYVYWIEDTGFVFPDEEIKVSSVGTPRILPNGDFMIPITFNKTLTDTRLQNFTDQFKSLLEKSNLGEIGFYYDAQLIGKLVMTDLPARASEFIKVNGIALKDYQNFGVSMYGNEIMIVISATDTKAITDLSFNLSVEICAGFRSLLGGVVENDAKYTYAYEKNEWVYGEYVTPEQPAKRGCASAINGETLWIMMLVVSVVVVCKKKYGVK